MTNIVGLIKDSAQTVLDGTLTIALTGPLKDSTTTPDTLFLPVAANYSVVDGVIDIDLRESATSQVPYKFTLEVYDVLGNAHIETFHAIVPNVGTVEWASLLPVGITNVNLDTSAYRVAELMANDENIAPLVKQQTISTYMMNDVGVTTKKVFPMTTATGLVLLNLNAVITSGAAGWTFRAGVINSLGQDVILTGTATTTTAGGRTFYNEVLNITQPNTIKGVFIEIVKGVSSTDISGTISLSHIASA
jgi:hypothetical protein